MSFSLKIHKDFGSFQLNVDISSSGTLALLGPSGSGKSLTLKCIAGIIKPDSGYIEVNGRVLFDSEKRINLTPQERNVGYMFQSYALFPNMNVYQNIALGYKEKDKEIKKQKVVEMINLFQLEKVSNLYPKQISGGEAQRTALARILIGNPEMILLDEPFSALDEHLRTKLELEMKQILSTYQGDVVLVTHNRDEAYLLSDNTCIISHGENVVIDKTKELFKNPRYLSAAIISGCKNIYPIEVIDEHNIFIADFNKKLTLKQKVDSDISYIGIRAHALKEDNKTFIYPINIKDIEEEPFEYLIRFKYEGQKEDSEDIYYRTRKDKKITNITQLGFDEEDILLLKDK